MRRKIKKKQESGPQLLNQSGEILKICFYGETACLCEPYWNIFICNNSFRSRWKGHSRSTANYV